MKRRVVVTGIGLVTPLGGSARSTWTNMLASRSGIRTVTRFDVKDIPVSIGGFVPEGDEPDALNADQYMPPAEQRRVDHFIVYGVSAASQAIEDSGWSPQTDEERERTGVMIGAGIGGLPRIEDTVRTLHEKGFRRVSPFFIPSCLINLVSGHVSIKYGLKGPNHATVTACASGAHAIGDAARLIEYGDADVMVAGGAEAAICPVGMAGFAAARALSTRNDAPQEASRPWDEGRDGFVMGEGSGILVLEEYEHAKKRGARIYGELIGYGLSGDAHHVTAPAPDGDGGFRAMSAALKRAGLNPSDIDYINAHGTSTPMGDEIEFGAVKRLFGSACATLSMSSTKSSIGHLLGAAGGVEAALSLLAMRDNIMPPTLNLHNPSQSCLGIDLVPHKAKEKKLNRVLSNAFGFGGTNASLIFQRVD
ncbi:MAG: beta-ketoacyl-ACP synthase II [Proteobacteria bacterium]|nr:beta-ketoacyl-ACP synthase II [Pseudomonadota bacterium]